jgi:hypothetical protein
MPQTPRHPISIELSEKDCQDLIKLIEAYGKNKGNGWDAWARNINQTIQTSINNSQTIPMVHLLLDEQNWNVIITIIQTFNWEDERREWAKKTVQLIIDATKKAQALLPPSIISPAYAGGEKATTLEESTPVYQQMNNNFPPFVVLPSMSEINIVLNIQNAGKTWTKIVLSDNREGFVLPTTRVFIIHQRIIIDDRGANIYEATSTDAKLQKHFEKGTLIYLLGPVPNASNKWVKIRDFSGNEGYMPGDTILDKPKKEGGEQHNVPKCLHCGYVGPWIVGPLFTLMDWIIGGALLVAFGGGLIYMLLVGISRWNPNNRSKKCAHCGTQNMFTFVYNQ